MKKNSLFLILLLFLFACTENKKAEEKKKPENKKENNQSDQPSPNKSETAPLDFSLLKSGDIVLQTLEGQEGDLISMATQSPFTHCGIILQQKNNGLVVLEAFGKVQKTPLKTWIEQGKDKKYIVMRIKNHEQYQNKMYITKATETLQAMMNLPYDGKYLWNDKEMYCSELVWKFFKLSLNVELCALHKLSEYDLNSEEVKVELKNKYGNEIPMNEPMVSPGDIAASDMLDMLYSNY